MKSVADWEWRFEVQASKQCREAEYRAMARKAEKKNGRKRSNREGVRDSQSF